MDVNLLASGEVCFYGNWACAHTNTVEWITEVMNEIDLLIFTLMVFGDLSALSADRTFRISNGEIPCTCVLDMLFGVCLHGQYMLIMFSIYPQTYYFSLGN